MSLSPSKECKRIKKITGKSDANEITGNGSDARNTALQSDNNGPIENTLCDGILENVSPDQKYHIYFDLETTGLSKLDRIIQIAAVHVKINKHSVPHAERATDILNQINIKINPDYPMSQGATKVTGITDHDLQGEKSTEEGLSEFLSWLKKIKSDTGPDANIYIVAYNGFSFDFPVLAREVERVMYKNILPMGYLPRFSQFLRDAGINAFIDPLIWIKTHLNNEHGLLRTKRGTFSYKLSDIHTALLHCQLTGAHDALADTTGLARVCHHRYCIDLMSSCHKRRISGGCDHIRTPDRIVRDISRKRNNN